MAKRNVFLYALPRLHNMRLLQAGVLVLRIPAVHKKKSARKHTHTANVNSATRHHNTQIKWSNCWPPLQLHLPVLFLLLFLCRQAFDSKIFRRSTVCDCFRKLRHFYFHPHCQMAGFMCKYIRCFDGVSKVCCATILRQHSNIATRNTNMARKRRQIML